MNRDVHIGEASRLLGVTPEHLRNLERAGRIPTPRRDLNGRVYTRSDLALLESLGVGQRPRRLKHPKDVKRPEDGRTELQITYRFGPPPTSEVSADQSSVGPFKNGSRS